MSELPSENATEGATREPSRSVTLALGVVLVLFTLVALGLSIIPLSGVNPQVAIPAAAISALFGFPLLRRRESASLAGVAELARREGDPVAAYEKLSKLFGLRGFLTTTNITGMPFATICMTIIFCAIALASHIVNAIAASNGATAGIIPVDFPNGVLELAKLTLGAFIGSFVNR